jgi:uncharacterized protein YndB with AHSA1/START domain
MPMSEQQIRLFQTFDVPADTLWEAVIDHEGMRRWLGAPCKVVTGPVDGGAGTIRRFFVGPYHFDEEILEASAPTRLVYRIKRGLPVKYHRGEMRVEPTADGRSTLTWEIALEASIPGATGLMRRGVEAALTRGLHRLARQLEQRGATTASRASST